MADAPDLSKLGSTPIPGAQPAGNDVKYDDDFGKLRGEIAKLETMNPNVDWDLVVTLGTSILAKKSKDLSVAAYLTAGLWERQGDKGMAIGLTVLQEMIAAFWEDLFPPKARMRGRIGALDWISDRVGKVMPSRPKPALSDKEAVEAAAKAAESLLKTCLEKVEGETNLTVLQRTIRGRLEEVPKPPPPAPKPEPKSEAAEAKPAQSAPPPPPPKKEIDTPASAKEAIAETTKTLVKAAGVLRKAEPTNPLPYRLLRWAFWGPMAELPADAKAGSQGNLDDLETKLSKKEYPAVVEKAEELLPATPLWLDLSFFAYRAMEAMGFPYENARQIIAEDVSSLVARWPALLTAKADGGGRLCQKTTSLWIANELRGGHPSAEGEGPREEKVRDARKLVARRKLTEAVQLLDQESKAASTRRERFLWRLDLAQLCSEGDKPALAMSLLESLDAEAQKFGLDEWEPHLCAEVLKLFWQCTRSLAQDDASKKKSDELYARLSSLDLSAALALDGKG